MLDGVVDIYLPDAKYSDNKNALRTSKMPKYVDYNQMTLREMYRQVGPLQLDDVQASHNVGCSFVISLCQRTCLAHARCYAGSQRSLGPDTPISLMDQYFPAWKAVNDPVLNRRLSWTEYRTALDALDEFDFSAGYVQEDLIEVDVTSNL